MQKEYSLEEKQKLILSWLAVDFNDEIEFLQKINRLTFGLLKENNLIIREKQQ